MKTSVSLHWKLFYHNEYQRCLYKISQISEFLILKYVYCKPWNFENNSWIPYMCFQVPTLSYFQMIQQFLELISLWSSNVWDSWQKCIILNDLKPLNHVRLVSAETNFYQINFFVWLKVMYCETTSSSAIPLFVFVWERLRDLASGSQVAQV